MTYYLKYLIIAHDFNSHHALPMAIGLSPKLSINFLFRMPLVKVLLYGGKQLLSLRSTVMFMPLQIINQIQRCKGKCNVEYCTVDPDISRVQTSVVLVSRGLFASYWN